MNFKVRELKGLKSLRAFNAFNTLMLGIKMLPAYINESYEEFYDRVEKMPEEDAVKIIRESVAFVNLERDEVEGLLCFCEDANGVPISTEQMKGMGVKDIFECVVAVASEISKIKIDMVKPSEKKNSETSQLT
jgi:hypothetical protein